MRQENVLTPFHLMKEDIDGGFWLTIRLCSSTKFIL